MLFQSGSAVADWALIQDRWRAENTSKVFAKSLGCSTESSWKLFDCLKRRSYIDLGEVDFRVSYIYSSYLVINKQCSVFELLIKVFETRFPFALVFEVIVH